MNDKKEKKKNKKNSQLNKKIKQNQQNKRNTWKIEHPQKVSSYLKKEKWPLFLVTVSGLIYNIGIVLGPYFEGQLVQCLYDISQKKRLFTDMLLLAAAYIGAIMLVQGMRAVKRFYVRRFANDTARNMRHMLYNAMLYMDPLELREESVGSMMTKSLSDVDACAEGMRKTITEVFDTGISLCSYLVMLCMLDYKLTILACIFTPAAFFLAEKMKVVIYRYQEAYKETAGELNDQTMDRISNALTYRVFGMESRRNTAYEGILQEYENKAVKANVWENTLKPVYQLISMSGVLFILYFGTRNLTGNGFTVWNLAAFTTFLSCFTKMATRFSKAADLLHAIQKAQVSFKRIRPYLKEYIEPEKPSDTELPKQIELVLEKTGIIRNDGVPLFKGLSLRARAGQIIGVTGPVACGKSAFGKMFIGEIPYEGRILLNHVDIRNMSEYERSRLITYQGHNPELMSDTIYENITLGENRQIDPYLQAVRLDAEVDEMEEKSDTYVGNGGVRLSGGQQDRVALARSLYHAGGVLILDDPFSAVDAGTEQEIVEFLRQWGKSCLIILISHRIRYFHTFDQVLFFNQGKYTIGTHQELMEEEEIYRKLYRLQCQQKDNKNREKVIHDENK